MSLTTDLNDPEISRGPVIRPVRQKYKHVGERPRFPLRDLTAEEAELYKNEGFVKFEVYPESEAPATGRFWTDKQLRSGCGSLTTMGIALAETYARQPTFYGATYCCGCQMHRPVSEFAWEPDGSVVGT